MDRNGELDLDDLRKALRPDTGIVSVMMANNETGVLFPIHEIGRIVRDNSDALLHVDGVQAVGKIPIDLKECQHVAAGEPGGRHGLDHGIDVLRGRGRRQVAVALTGCRLAGAPGAAAQATCRPRLTT